MARPDIHRRQQVFERDKFRLELNHKKRACGRVKGQDVNDPAFAVDRKRDLGSLHPSWQGAQIACYNLVQSGMAGIHESVEFAMRQCHRQLETDFQHGCDTAKDR